MRRSTDKAQAASAKQLEFSSTWDKELRYCNTGKRDAQKRLDDQMPEASADYEHEKERRQKQSHWGDSWTGNLHMYSLTMLTRLRVEAPS